VDAAIETNAKYNYLRGQQEMMFGSKVPLMPGVSQPTLPTLDKLVPSDLLREAQEAAPPGTTPAERAEITSGSATAPPAPAAPPPAAEQTAPTAPFSSPQAAEPAALPPQGTSP
jgi:hypothetical protein